LAETFRIELPGVRTVPTLVTLRHFRDIPEALLAKGKLESAGIECVLADGNLVRMDWLLSNAIGGIRLQVDQQDLEFARAVLDEPIPAEFGAEEVGETFVQPRCPRCCSLDIGFEKIDRFWTYGLWLLLSFPIRICKGRWKCYGCGMEWVEPENV
jgi:Putative prokaryotic signal transducing protein